MMRDSVKEFVDREIWPLKARLEQHDYALTEELMQKAGEMGLLGVAVPEEYGGLGMGFVTTMLVCDYMSGASGSVATAFGAHTGIGTMPITLYGTEEQKKKYVPKLATGEWFGAYALTEPGAGSDANSGKTKAVLSEDGKTYAISGQKCGFLMQDSVVHSLFLPELKTIKTLPDLSLKTILQTELHLARKKRN